MKLSKILIIALALFVGLIISVPLIDIKFGGLFFNVVGLLFTGVFLLIISNDKRLISPSKVENNNQLKLLKRLRPIIRLTGGVFIIISIYSSVRLHTDTRRGWSDEIFDKEVEECFKLAGEYGQIYPDLTFDYCNCATSKMRDSLSYKEYQKYNELTMEELLGIIQECVDVYQESIKNEKKNPTSPDGRSLKVKIY